MENVTFPSFPEPKEVNPIQDGPFRGCSSMGWGQQKGPLSLKSVTHTIQWWNLAQLYYT